MNIIASALHDTEFVRLVVEHRPTLLRFFELALAGELAGFSEETRDLLRMRAGMDVVRDRPLARQAAFIVFPAWQWEIGKDDTDDRFTGTFAHVRLVGDIVVIVPDDGDHARYTIALYRQESQPGAVTKLTAVRYRPQSLTVEEDVRPCAEGYQVVGEVRRGTCVNDACPGKCVKRTRLKRGIETFRCPCS